MKRKLTLIVLMLFWMCGMSGSVMAQQNQSNQPKQQNQQKKKQGASTNTSWDARVDAEPKKQKQYKTIYKREAYGAFLGNKCVEETTRKMGFNYELVPRQGPASKTATGVFLHNSGTKFLLLIKNGPFWQYRLRKKIDECRMKTGDYIG